MLRIGIVGLGFMGKAHFNGYQSLAARGKVVAISDVDAKKREGDWSAIRGNIDVGEQRVDLSSIRTFADADELIAWDGVDVVDITLPTYLHARYTIAALKAGKHVICEKPMAVSADEAFAMAKAARESGRRLFVGQCIRFWPAYRTAAEIVRSEKYGAVRTARFQRLSSTPLWSWDQWLMDAKRSGLAALDLHIHDADFVLHLFGKPAAVTAHGASIRAGGYDHIVAQYAYPDGKLVFAEGAWEYAPDHPFAMVFTIQMDKGTLVLDAAGALTFYPQAGGKETVSVAEGSGYDHELAHFLEYIAENKESAIITPESAAESVALVEAEIKSAATGQPVAFGS